MHAPFDDTANPARLISGALSESRCARWRNTLAITVLGAFLGALACAPTQPRLVWNFTASVPLGLYAIVQTPPKKGDLLALKPSGAIGAALRDLGVLRRGRLLLKPLAADAGDTACRSGAAILINGEPAAQARSSLSDGRQLPTWSGCHVLSADEVLVLAHHPLSVDSRYFGPFDRKSIVGVARPFATYLPSTEGVQ